MTNKEAIEIIRAIGFNTPVVHTGIKDCHDFYEAIDLAIKALEERTCEWILDKEESITMDFYKCTNCGFLTATNCYHYCPNCGARKEADDVKPCSSCTHYNNGNRKSYPCGSCFINSHNMWEAEEK